jgi:hypothetical protein
VADAPFATPLHVALAVLQSESSGAKPPKALCSGPSTIPPTPLGGYPAPGPQIERPERIPPIVAETIPPTPVGGYHLASGWGAGSWTLSPCSTTGRTLLSATTPLSPASRGFGGVA